MTVTPRDLRVPNVELRRARQSMRLSQAEFADAVRATGNALGEPNSCSKRLVQKWETGEHAGCRPEYLRVLQAVTGLTANELGFEVMPDDSGISKAISHKRAQDAAAASANVSAIRKKIDYSSEELIDGARDQLRHALNHPSHVDSRTADFVEMSTERLFVLEHHSPARLLTPTVDRHLGTATALLTAARHEIVRSRLTSSIGYGALLAGWLAFDRGDTMSAQRFWDDSISAAQGTAHGGLFAASLTYQSYAAARRRDIRTAWQLAHAASSATPDDARATAWSATRVALHAAQLGERKAAEAAMELALEVGNSLPNPAPGDGGQPWTRSFDQARLLSSTAQTAALLKDPSAADYATKAVNALGPDKVKARAVVLAEVSFTFAVVGDLELCLKYGSEASTLTREMDVSTATDLLVELIPNIMPYSDTRAVRRLLPQLAGLTRVGDRAEMSEREAAEQKDAEAPSGGWTGAAWCG